MPLLYLVRHGQTDWNAQLRLQGQTDTPLNDTGRAQADRNGRVLAGLIGEPGTFDFVASPLVRTRETMEIVRDCLGLPRTGYRTDDRLMEINFGAWQGYTWDELRARSASEIEARFADPWNTVAPGAGGESFAMVSARVLDWLEELERDTVAVAHGGINRCLRGHVERIAVQDIPLLDVPQDKVWKVADGRAEWL